MALSAATGAASPGREPATTTDGQTTAAGRRGGDGPGDERPAARSGGGPSPAASIVLLQRLVVIAIVCAAGAAIAWTVWPGRMSNDTLTQLASVRTGTYTDWHAGLLLVLWRPFWLLGAGPAWITLLGAVCFIAGLYGTARLVLGRAASLVAALAITATPMVLGYVGYLGRDLWFLAFFVATVACLGLAVRSSGRRARLVGIVGGLAFIWLMMAARQNAVAPAGVLLVGGLVALSRTPTGHRPRHARPASGRGAAVRTFAGRVAVAAAVLVVLVASQAVGKRLAGVEGTHPEQAVYIYDLAALSHREGRLLFSPANFPSQDLARLEALYDPINVNPLLFGPEAPVPFPVQGEAFETLRADWRRAVLDHPRGYLAVKWRMWTEQIALTGPTQWVYHPVVDPNPYGYATVHVDADARLNRYLRAFAANDQLTGGWAHTVWVYLLVVTAGCWYLRDRRAGHALLGWVCVAVWAYEATIFLGAMGVGYRFQLPIVVVALVVAAAAGRDLLHAVRRRPA